MTSGELHLGHRKSRRKSDRKKGESGGLRDLLIEAVAAARAQFTRYGPGPKKYQKRIPEPTPDCIKIDRKRTLAGHKLRDRKVNPKSEETVGPRGLKSDPTF